MRCLLPLLLLLFTGIGTSSLGWVIMNRTCYSVNSNSQDEPTARTRCEFIKGTLHSVKSATELAELGSLLAEGRYYWVGLNKPNQAFIWDDGRSCCDTNWWGASPQLSHKCGKIGRPANKTFLWSAVCTENAGYLCSKPAVLEYVPRNKSSYTFSDLCGVEIMRTCNNQPCEALCDSHPDCTHFAKLSNICINIKNVSQSDDCGVKLQRSMELYEKRVYCKAETMSV